MWEWPVHPAGPAYTGMEEIQQTPYPIHLRWQGKRKQPWEKRRALTSPPQECVQARAWETGPLSPSLYSFSSPEKQNQWDVYRYIYRERFFVFCFFMELACTVVEAAESKICRVGQLPGDPGKTWYFSSRPEAGCWLNSFFFRGLQPVYS